MPEVERPKALQDAKPTERSLKGKCVGDFRGIVQCGFGRVEAGREVCDNNIKKRSLLFAVTAYLLYWYA